MAFPAAFRVLLLIQIQFLLPSTAFLINRFLDEKRARRSHFESSTISTVAAGRSGFDEDNVDYQQRLLTKNLLMDRRDVLLSSSSPLASLLFCASSLPLRAAAETPSSSVLSDLVAPQADSTRMQSGLLESRVMENVMSTPTYGMEGPDIFYPDWFVGVWTVSSKTSDVEAPCGLQLFGGNATYASARAEIGGPALKYQSRFIADGNAHVIADREYNVKAIARAAMGANSVVDVSLATPNKFSCLLSPMGASSLMTVDLITLARRQENNVRDGSTSFDCSEVVRQIVSPVNQKSTSAGGAPKRSTLLKEIETTSLYTASVGNGQEVKKITCRQRSATFLLPSQDDPMALKAWEYSRGRPIDVRFYDVTYTKD